MIRPYRLAPKELVDVEIHHEMYPDVFYTHKELKLIANRPGFTRFDDLGYIQTIKQLKDPNG